MIRRGSGKAESRTKTGKTRRVDASDELLSVLDSLRKRKQTRCLAEGKNQIPQWAFCNQQGNAMDMQNIYNHYFKPTLTKAGLRPIYGGAANPLVPAPYPSPNIDWDADADE